MNDIRGKPEMQFVTHVLEYYILAYCRDLVKIIHNFIFLSNFNDAVEWLLECNG